MSSTSPARRSAIATCTTWLSRAKWGKIGLTRVALHRQPNGAMPQLVFVSFILPFREIAWKVYRVQDTVNPDSHRLDKLECLDNVVVLVVVVLAVLWALHLIMVHPWH